MFKGRSVDVVQIAGKYEVEKNENLEQYLKQTGMPEETIAKLMQVGTTTEIHEDGNKYTIALSFGMNMTFTLDEEFEEPMVQGLKSIAKRDGNVITVTSTFADGKTGVRKYEFTQTAMTATFTLNGVSAKRYYKRV